VSVGTLGGGAYVIFLPLCFPLLLSVAVRHLGYTRINLSGQSIATFWMVIVTGVHVFKRPLLMVLYSLIRKPNVTLNSSVLVTMSQPVVMLIINQHYQHTKDYNIRQPSV